MSRSRLHRARSVRNSSAPAPVVKRLSLYLRGLEELADQKIEKVSSQQLAHSLRLTGAQVRKDLAYFGQFGRPGVGYHVGPLIETLRRILGTDKTWNVIVVGAGDLGRALLRYKGFAKKGFRLVAAFDIAEAKVSVRIDHIRVYRLKDLDRIVRKYTVKLAIVTVPAEAGQSVTDLLCAAGVMGILNFAPTTLHIPDGVAVAPVDLAAQLEQLSFQVAGARVKR